MPKAAANLFVGNKLVNSQVCLQKHQLRKGCVGVSFCRKEWITSSPAISAGEVIPMTDIYRAIHHPFPNCKSEAIVLFVLARFPACAGSLNEVRYHLVQARPEILDDDDHKDRAA
jgi:hypothetical protein